MNLITRMGTLLAGLLVGLGIAVFAKTMREVGTDHFALGYVVGPGLIAAGLARIKLQRMLEGSADDAGGDEHG